MRKHGLGTFVKVSVVTLAALFPAMAKADSISTGVADWQLTNVTELGAPAILVPGEVTVGSSAAILPAGNPGWASTSAIQAIDPSAKWISASTNGANDGVWGWYTYSLILQSPPLAPGTYDIHGTYSSDNMVDSFKINGTEFINSTPVASPSAIYGFDYTYTVNAQATAGPQAPIEIDVRVYNESTSQPTPFQLDGVGNPNVIYPVGVTDPGSTTNPTGFILAGTIDPVAVPLPSAAWSGLALFTLLGAAKIAGRVRKLA